MSSVTLEDAVAALKAAGDPSRLRILAVLRDHELTVSELVDVLAQSQPRVSRHLRVLGDAGLVARTAEGTSAFYRLHRSAAAWPFVSTLVDGLDTTTGDPARDRDRLAEVRLARTQRADAYFREVAAEWDRMRSRHVDDAEIEARLVETLTAHDVGTLVDLGTGTGRILEIAAPHVDRGIGVDRSRDMLAVARTKLEAAGVTHCHVRQGDVHDLRLPVGSVDAAVLHHVLHFLDDPAHALLEAARVLRSGGLAIIVDFAPHTVEALRELFEHRRLGFDEAEVGGWLAEAGFGNLEARTFTPRHLDRGEALPVTIWTATRLPALPTTDDAHIEAA